MKENGFTLIELITVISILSIIGIIMLPKINTAFKTSKADQLEGIRENVVKSSEVYLESNCGKDDKTTLNDVGQIKIFLKEIEECGLIRSSIYNPVSGEYFDIENEYIIVKKDELNTLNYEFSF